MSWRLCHEHSIYTIAVNRKMSYMLGIIRMRKEPAMPQKQPSWEERAKRYLKAELKRADVSYRELAELLKKHGLEETETSIASKLSRGTFAATFFLASLAAIGCEFGEPSRYLVYLINMNVIIALCPIYKDSITVSAKFSHSIL